MHCLRSETTQSRRDEKESRRGPPSRSESRHGGRQFKSSTAETDSDSNRRSSSMGYVFEPSRILASDIADKTLGSATQIRVAVTCRPPCKACPGDFLPGTVCSRPGLQAWFSPARPSSRSAISRSKFDSRVCFPP